MAKDLEKWVRSQVFNARASGECRELVLRHINDGKLGGAVQTFEITADHKTDPGVEALATEIDLVAMADASGLGGLQQYCLLSFHGANEKHSARKTWRIDGEADSEDDFGVMSEPGNIKGAFTQAMRHNEALMKIAVMGANNTITMQARMLESMSSRMENMEQDRIKNLEAFQEIMTLQHERELANRKQDNREQMQRELLKKAGPLLTVVANRVSGGKMLPAPVKEGMGALMESLQSDPERFSVLMKLLKPEEMALLAELTGFGDKKESA